MRPDSERSKAAYVALIKLAELAQSRLRDLVANWNESEKRFVVRRDGDEPSVAILLRGHEAKIAQHSKRNAKKRERAHSEHAKVLARPVGPLTVGELVQRVLFMEDHGLGDFTVLFFVLMRTCLSFGEGVEAAKRTLRYASLLGYKVLERSETGLQDVKEHTIVESAVLRSRFGNPTEAKDGKKSRKCYPVFERQDGMLCVAFNITQLGRATDAIGVNLREGTVGVGRLYRPTWHDLEALAACASAEALFEKAKEDWNSKQETLILFLNKYKEALILYEGILESLIPVLDRMKKAVANLPNKTAELNEKNAEIIGLKIPNLGKSLTDAKDAITELREAITHTRSERNLAYEQVRARYDKLAAEVGVNSSLSDNEKKHWDKLDKAAKDRNTKLGNVLHAIRNVTDTYDVVQDQVQRFFDRRDAENENSKANQGLGSAQEAYYEAGEASIDDDGSVYEDAEDDVTEPDTPVPKDAKVSSLEQKEADKKFASIGDTLKKDEVLSGIEKARAIKDSYVSESTESANEELLSYKKALETTVNTVREQDSVISQARKDNAGRWRGTIHKCIGHKLDVRVDENDTMRVHIAVQISGELFLLVRSDTAPIAETQSGDRLVGKTLTADQQECLNVEKDAWKKMVEDAVQYRKFMISDDTRASVPWMWHFKTGFGRYEGRRPLPELLVVPLNLTYDTAEPHKYTNKVRLRYNGIYEAGAVRDKCMWCQKEQDHHHSSIDVMCSDGDKKLIRGLAGLCVFLKCKHEEKRAKEEKTYTNTAAQIAGDSLDRAVDNAIGLLSNATGLVKNALGLVLGGGGWMALKVTEKATGKTI
jgi:hypothetical protein